MFDNTQGVTEIQMVGTTHLYCPLGDDFYTANTTITVSNPSTIPDYCDVTKFFESIDGEKLIIEDACRRMVDFIKGQTGNAQAVTVTIKVNDARHLPVSVTISD